MKGDRMPGQERAGIGAVAMPGADMVGQDEGWGQ